MRWLLIGLVGCFEVNFETEEADYSAYELPDDIDDVVDDIESDWEDDLNAEDTADTADTADTNDSGVEEDGPDGESEPEGETEGPEEEPIDMSNGLSVTINGQVIAEEYSMDAHYTVSHSRYAVSSYITGASFRFVWGSSDYTLQPGTYSCDNDGYAVLNDVTFSVIDFYDDPNIPPEWNWLGFGGCWDYSDYDKTDTQMVITEFGSRIVGNITMTVTGYGPREGDTAVFHAWFDKDFVDI